jgi:hypothetical protein
VEAFFSQEDESNLNTITNDKYSSRSNTMASRKYPRKQTQIGKKIKTYRKQGRHMQPQDNTWKEPSVMQPEEHSQQKQKT